VNAPDPKRSRLQFYIVIGLFLAPLVAAFALYYGAGHWRPLGQTNKGDLINPPRPLPEIALPLAQGGATDPSWLKGKWTLLYIGAGSCDEQCRQQLVHIRQTRTALGKDMVRVQRAFISTSRCCDKEYLAREHDGLIVVDTDPTAALLAQFPIFGAPVERAGRIYIVDPLGNLMMSYAPNAHYKALLDDLKKLLNLSHIG
jgi:cytochrome oxidase Cu insertion factor (SCO1/SenC/PrrC family)